MKYLYKWKNLLGAGNVPTSFGPIQMICEVKPMQAV